MLDDSEQAELDELCKSCTLSAMNLLTVEDAYEQLMPFATQ